MTNNTNTNNSNDNLDDFTTEIQSDETIPPWVEESCHGVTSDDALLQNTLVEFVFTFADEDTRRDWEATFSPDDPDNYEGGDDDGDCDGPDAADPGDLVFDSESGEWYEPRTTGRDAH